MTLATSHALGAVGGKALWFLTRASGLVAIALLSATIVVGVVASQLAERGPGGRR